MALTAYCKKCGREVPPAEICPSCGTKLGKTSVHAAWCIERRPAADWMCWNAVARVLLPTELAVLLMVLLMELISGGAGALERLFLSGFPMILGILFVSVTAVVFLALLLQGKDLTDCVVDYRGIHVTKYLPNPTPLKLLLRFRSPALMEAVNPGAGGAPVLRIDEREITWKDVARVQLWPEKCIVLFYAPSWWMRISITCTPFSWEDVMSFIREKLGKKKKVILPKALRSQPEKKPMAGATAAVLKEQKPIPADCLISEDLPPEDSSESSARKAESSEAPEGQISMEEVFREAEE